MGNKTRKARRCSRCGLDDAIPKSKLCLPCRAEWETPARLAAMKRRRHKDKFNPRDAAILGGDPSL